MSTQSAIDASFKAYDVRGVVPDELDEELAGLVGRAFAQEVVGDGADAVVVGHDMRPTSPGLARELADGVRAHGLDVVWIGLAATDEVYFASGRLDMPAAVVTASHNPAHYNGIKLCRAGAVPVGRSSGLDAIRDRCRTWLEHPPRPSARPGTLTERDVLGEYVDCLHGLAPVSGRRLRVVVDAGNGMAGLTAPAVLGGLDVVELVPLYFEPDGSFPHHAPDPLQPDNLRDVSAEVVRCGADLGLAFDGDADRCFALDESGRPISPAAVAALIAIRELAGAPGARVVHNLIVGRALPETVTAYGGVPVRTPVGHSLIKQTMAETRAVLGAEHSGHFYFRDFWRADSGMLAALHLLAALAADNRPVSALVGPLDRYLRSGEINISVPDPAVVLASVADRFADCGDVTTDRLDGLTVTAATWWFNVRPSNTEPLLRLNVEAESDTEMVEVRDFVLSLVRRST